MKIILDTNFLIDCIRFKIDLKSELAGNEIFILESTIDEIERVIIRGTEESTLAKLALELVNKSKFKIIETKEKDVDKSLISYSKEGYAIATHDKILKSRLKKLRVKLIYIRQKKYVIVE